MKTLFTIFSVVIFTILGCSTENPLTHCEDKEAEVIVTETTPPEPKPELEVADVQPAAFTIEVVDIADIVADTVKGDASYVRRLVSFTTVVKEIEVYPDGFGFLYLDTNEKDVFLTISTYQHPQDFADYEAGQAYEFTTFIILQEQGQENKDRFFIQGEYAKKELEEVTLETLVSDAKANNKRYEGKVIRFTAKVRKIGIDGSLSIDTEVNGVSFWIYGMDLSPQDGYVVKQSYTFTVFVASIDVVKPNFIYSISCYFFK